MGVIEVVEERLKLWGTVRPDGKTSSMYAIRPVVVVGKIGVVSVQGGP